MASTTEPQAAGVNAEQSQNGASAINTLTRNAPKQSGQSTLIQLKELSKSFDEGGSTRTVLDELSCEFQEGEFVCLLGRSGSGKSTLINLIAGLDAPTHGEVIINHNEGGQVQPVSITTLTERKRTLFRRNKIGIIFQFFNLIPTLTVLENVTLPMELAGADNDYKEQAASILERVGLGDRLETYPDKLSGGEQQRVAIARALSHDPLLILADEPTGNLDDSTGETVLNMLLELTRDAGKTLIMATHATDVADQADRVLHLVQGKLS